MNKKVNSLGPHNTTGLEAVSPASPLSMGLYISKVFLSFNTTSRATFRSIKRILIKKSTKESFFTDFSEKDSLIIFNKS